MESRKHTNYREWNERDSVACNGVRSYWNATRRKVLKENSMQWSLP